MKPERREAAYPHFQRATIAAVTASLLVLACGLGHRMLAAQLRAPMQERPIDPAVLREFPLKISDWVGEDVPLDARTVRMTGTDTHINRCYSRRSGAESISLYIACGVDARHLMSHRPEVCYLGAGWAPVARHSMELPLDDGETLPCSLFEFTRGGIDTREVTVLNFFIVDGEYCGDVSLLKSKAWRDFRAVGYAIQVQIIASSQSLGDDSGMRVACRFAADAASAMAWLVTAIENDRKADSPRGLQGEDNHP